MRVAAPSSRRTYTIVLSLVATGILIAGVSLRPKSAPAPVRSETEFLQLQLLAQRRDLERRSLFFQTKAQQLVTKSHAARTHPEQYPYTTPESGTTVILVATGSSGQPVWVTAAVAGTAEISCNGRSVEEVETTITIPKTLVNATAFDLDDNLAAFVIACGERCILTTLQGFQIASQPTLAEQLEARCGIQVALDPAQKEFEITKLDNESRLSEAGLKIGDRIAAINERPLETEEQLAALLEPPETILAVQRGRSRRLINITVPAQNPPAGEGAK
jgi:hypothetical protein